MINVPPVRREGNGKSIKIYGARGNNLKNINVEFPLGRLICVTGVSGGGKSSLINDTLQPILAKHFYRALREPLPYERIEGIEYIDKIVDVDQSPLGRTPRSNPATTYSWTFPRLRYADINPDVSLSMCRADGAMLAVEMDIRLWK